MASRLCRPSLLVALAVGACDSATENVGVTADGDRGDATSVTAGGAGAGGAFGAGTAGGGSTPSETCPEEEPEEGDPCELEELDTNGFGPRCLYNEACNDLCCIRDEYTCDDGGWHYFFDHCDPALFPPSPEPLEPTTEDGGVPWCTIAVDGSDVDPCYLLCARRQAFGCPGVLSPEMCRDACDEALVSAARVDESCMGLRCTYLSCLANRDELTCSVTDPCPEERGDYDATCRPTR